MFSLSAIGSKVIPSLKKGKVVAKKMALPQEISLINTMKTSANKKAFSSCGGMDMLCGLYNKF